MSSKKTKPPKKATTYLLTIILTLILLITVGFFYFYDKVEAEYSNNGGHVTIKLWNKRPYKALYCSYTKYDKGCRMGDVLENATVLVGGTKPPSKYNEAEDLTDKCGLAPYDKLKLPSIEDFDIRGPKWSPDCQRLVYSVLVSSRYIKELGSIKQKEGIYVYTIKINNLQKLTLDRDCVSFIVWKDSTNLVLNCSNEQLQSQGEFVYDVLNRTFDTPQL